MKSLIWQKGDSSVDEQIMAFCAGDDVVLDRQLFAYDVRASVAHVRGLGRIGVLSDEEAEALVDGLGEVLAEFESGEFVLDERFEDGHSAIEARLIEKLGETGKKVHTGRSRNDQVLVATRLFLKDQLGSLQEICASIADAALQRAEPTMLHPMPGYTHLQRAVPSSVGMWFAAFAEAFVDDAALAKSTADWIDANPLGTAAGYGVNLPLDREGTTDELGFGRMQVNPIYAQNSRGKFELAALGAFGQALLDVRRLAWDLSLFTTAEFDFVHLPDEYTTGSSIMPNKRNPDVVELLRAAYSTVAGARAELESVLALPSGYHRDLQNTKPALLRGVSHALRALSLIPSLLIRMEFDVERTTEAVSDDMYATDVAVELTGEGVPFRDAYRRAAEDVTLREGRTPDASLRARTSPGASGAPLLSEIRRRLDAVGA